MQNLHAANVASQVNDVGADRVFAARKRTFDLKVHVASASIHQITGLQCVGGQRVGQCRIGLIARATDQPQHITHSGIHRQSHTEYGQRHGGLTVVRALTRVGGRQQSDGQWRRHRLQIDRDRQRSRGQADVAFFVAGDGAQPMLARAQLDIGGIGTRDTHSGDGGQQLAIVDLVVVIDVIKDHHGRTWRCGTQQRQ